MDKQARPLQDYFIAARDEPGISEQEVREIVRRAPAAPAGAHRRWLGAAAGLAGVIAIGYVALTVNPSGTPAPPASASVAAGPQAGLAAPTGRTDGSGSSSAIAPEAAVDAAIDAASASPAIASGSNGRQPSTTNSTTPSISTQGTTMNRKNIVRGVTTAALAMGMTTAASAQSTEAPTPDKRKEIRVEIEHRVSPPMQRMASELGRSAADFWTERLNGYKARIDRILSPADRDALNRMRVRFGVMLAEHAEIDAEGLDANEKVVIHRKEASDGGEASASDGKREVRKEIKIQVKGDGEGAMEFFELHQGARELASKYRTDFDGLGRDVLADFVTFVREMSEAGQAFMKENRVEIEKYEDGKEVSLALGEVNDVIGSLDTEEKRMMMQMVYSFAAEPLVMLYDGAELRDFFGQAGPLSSAVTGLNLPTSSVLKQNAPNPASGETTIAYSLQEPSAATMLRVYDASGALVGTYDQGAREAGEHAATIDLSAMPAGVYLYHLTVKTPAGERVYSKTMQVVR